MGRVLNTVDKRES